MKTAKKIFNELLASIYPNKCICCGKILDEHIRICDKCDNSIERLNLDNICLDCGLEKDDCVCRYNVFRFNALVCAFKNTNIARQAYYSYKFLKKQHYADFFADEICRAVMHCYSDITFDIVCAVPSYSKFGYDHSGYIARAVSKKLDIPFADKLLRCLKRVKKQHKSTIKERLLNADGKYIANYRIDDKRVLLIDDIKTTGATIDECSKILLFAGAESVYCATVLVSLQNNKNKN